MAIKCEDEGLEIKSTLVSRNVTIMGRRTSIRLEPEMWTALRDIARREQCKIHDICSLVAARKNDKTSLTAAIRVFLMLYYRASSTEDGHERAGHGHIHKMMKRARMSEYTPASPAFFASRQMPEGAYAGAAGHS